MTTHLSEAQLQEYALDTVASGESLLHLETCPACMAKLKEYQVLFTGLSSLPSPAFDFDLASSVVAQLNKESAKTSTDSKFLYWMIFVAVILLTIPLYIFRSYLQSLCNGIVATSLYLGGTIAVILLIFQSIELYRRHLIKMQELNYY